MNFLKHFLSYDFLFYINRVHLEPVDTVFAITAVALIVIALALRVRMQYEKHMVRRGLLSRFWKLSMTMGLLGALWYGARFQLVGWFGTHMAFLLLVLVGLVWLGFIIRYWSSWYGKERTAWDQKQLKEKYLQMKK